MVSIRRSGMRMAAVRVDAVPVVLVPVVGAGAIRAELALCAEWSWRLDVAGSGPSAWASDGPWSQMVREGRAGDYDARGGEMGDAGAFDRESAGAMTLDQLARLERASGWMMFFARRGRWTKGLTTAISDGRIVAAVARADAMRGCAGAGAGGGADGAGARTDWVRVAAAVGLDAGCAARMRMRHARAMAWLAREVAVRDVSAADVATGSSAAHVSALCEVCM